MDDKHVTRAKVAQRFIDSVKKKRVRSFEIYLEMIVHVLFGALVVAVCVLLSII